MKTWKNSPQKLLIIHNQQFFSLPAWLSKRPILGRNRNFIGSPCLLSTVSLDGTVHKYVTLCILLSKKLSHLATIMELFLVSLDMHYKICVPKKRTLCCLLNLFELLPESKSLLVWICNHSKRKQGWRKVWKSGRTSKLNTRIMFYK